VKGGIEVGGTRHRAPTFLQDAEVVAEQLSGSMRLVCCQGSYFVECQGFDLLGRARWVDAEATDVAEWFATFLAELRGDE
jgi:hypothetical protein